MARFAAVSPFVARPLVLASLDQTGLENLFRAWVGASGRRYVCSIYAVSDAPAFDCARAVVAAVRKGAHGAEIVFVFQPRDEADFAQWALRARQFGAGEFHAHLLAGSNDERENVLRDLAPRRLALAA